MKRLTIPLFALTCFLHLDALFATEVTIYPYTSQDVTGKPLVISEYVTGETLVKPRKWTFPGATYETRTVWNVQVETNTILESWIDLNGNGSYDVNEPYGTNAGRDYPEIELTDHGIECTRIDLVSDTSDSMITRDDVMKGLTVVYNQPYRWSDSNMIVTASIPAEGARVRIVRWRYDNDYLYRWVQVPQRVLFDRIILPSGRKCITEADIYSYSGNCDLDMDHFCDEVVNIISYGLTYYVCLVVIGDGDFYFENLNSTNTVYALNTVCVRKHNDLNWGITQDETMRTDHRFGKVVFSWKMNSTNDFYGAYRIIATNESLRTSYDTGRFRTPARDMSGVMKWACDLQPGSWLWRISGYNSKYSKDDSRERNFSKWIPFTVP